MSHQETRLEIASGPSRQPLPARLQGITASKVLVRLEYLNVATDQYEIVWEAEPAALPYRLR